MKEVFEIRDWPYVNMQFEELLKSVSVSEILSVRISFLDTGCNSGLEFLKGMKIEERKIKAETAYKDRVGHGTCFASILGQYIHDEGKNCPYVTSIKIGDNPQMPVGNIIEGLEMCIEEKYDIVNIGISNCNYNHEMAKMISRLNEMGTIVIAPAGNNIKDADTYPACLNNVLSCGAKDKYNQITNISNRNAKIDFYIPGEDIMGNIGIAPDKGDNLPPCDANGWSRVSGTSFSAAIMTAFAAILKAKFPNITCYHIKSAMKKISKYESGFYDVLKEVSKITENAANQTDGEHYLEIRHSQDYRLNGKWTVDLYDECGNPVRAFENSIAVKIEVLKSPDNKRAVAKKWIKLKNGSCDFNFENIKSGIYYIRIGESENGNRSISMAVMRPQIPTIALKHTKEGTLIAVDDYREEQCILYAFDNEYICVNQDGTFSGDTKRYKREIVIGYNEHHTIHITAFENGVFSDFISRKI